MTFINSVLITVCWQEERGTSKIHTTLGFYVSQID